ncbi:hypothetical protein HYV12_04025 [Candidatus Dojkabacteria bacterium]|nr:hypothetical protein [Candidatus Dojkabacteria bacterium]
MAGKRKDKYENALQSISDFIFKNSGKRVKVKPGKISGASGHDAMAKALAEVAARPGVVISTSLMNTINDTFGSQAWLQFYVDKLSEEKHTGADPDEGRFRVRPSETASFVTNPRKYVQKIFDSAAAERKWAAKVGLAGYVDGVVAMQWARKNGASMNEAMKMLYSANFDLQPMHREEAHKLAVETAALESFDTLGKAQEAGTDLYNALNSSSLTRGSKTTTSAPALGREFSQTLDVRSRALWQKAASGTSLDAGEQANFVKLQVLEKNFTAGSDKYRRRYDKLQDELRNLKDPTGKRKYSDPEIQKLLDNYVDNRDISRLGLTGSEMKAKDKYDELHPTVYRRLLIKNMDAKMRLLDPSKNPEDFKRTAASIGIVSLWQRAYGGTTSDDYNALKSRIQNEMNQSSTTMARKSELAKILAEAEVAQKSSHSGLSYLAQYTGVTGVPHVGRLRSDLAKYIDVEEKYWKNKYDDLLSISSSGGLTDDQKRELERVTRRLSVLGTERDGLKTLPWAGARITVGQVSNMFRSYQSLWQGGKGGLLVNGMFWVSDVAGIHAPGKIDELSLSLRDAAGKFKSETVKGIVQRRTDIHSSYSQLANLYYLSPGSIMKTILWNGEGFVYAAAMREKAAKALLTKFKGDIVNVLGISEDDFGKALSNDYFKLIDKLKGLNNPLINKFIGKVDRISQSAETVGKIGMFYQTNISGAYFKKFADIRGKIMGKVGMFLKGKIQSEMWNGAVDKFVAGAIGLKQLIYTGVEAILQAANITVSGGFMSLIVGAASYVITEGIYKAAKPLLEVLAGMASIIAFFFVFLIILILGLSANAFSSRSNPARAYYPGSAIACTNYNPHEGMYPEPAPDIPGTGYPPSDASCPFTFGSK